MQERCQSRKSFDVYSICLSTNSLQELLDKNSMFKNAECKLIFDFVDRHSLCIVAFCSFTLATNAMSSTREMITTAEAVAYWNYCNSW